MLLLPAIRVARRVPHLARRVAHSAPKLQTSGLLRHEGQLISRSSRLLRIRQTYAALSCRSFAFIRVRFRSRASYHIRAKQLVRGSCSLSAPCIATQRSFGHSYGTLGLSSHRTLHRSAPVLATLLYLLFRPLLTYALSALFSPSIDAQSSSGTYRLFATGKT